MTKYLKNKKIKILVLAGTPPPLHGETIMNKRLLESKFSESFDIFHVQYRFAESISDIGIIRIKKIIKFILYIFQTMIILIKNKIDVVYRPIVPKGLPFIRDAILLQIVRAFKTPYILHLHGKGVKKGFENSSFFTKYLYKRVFGQAIGVIHLGKALLSDIEHLVKKENIYVVSNGIPNLTNRCNYGESIIKNKKRILFLSRMSKDKGPLVLLYAVPYVVELLPDVRFFFIGDWVENHLKEKFIRFITENNLKNNVKYLGPVYGSKKERFLDDCDLLVYPTFNDAFPLVILEAMRAGLPVIATDEGTIPEIILDGKTGYIVPKKDSKKLADKIIELLENPEKARKMGEAGRKRFEENYTIEVFEKNMIDVVNKILTRNA